MFNDSKNLIKTLTQGNTLLKNNDYTLNNNLVNHLNGTELSHNFDNNCKNSPSNFELNSSNIYVNDKIKKKLKKLLNQYPEGIWCSDLSKLYIKNYNYSLDYKEFGCTSLIHFVSQIPDVVKCVRPGQGDWLLFDAQSDLSNYDYSKIQINGDSGHSDLDNNIKSEKNCVPLDKDSFSIPKDVAGPEASWVKIDMTDSEIIGAQFEVSTAEVWSPNKFFVHIKKFSNAFEKFVSDLQDFYNVNFSKYKMPDSVIKPKQICIGYYSTDSMTKEEWHRMQILQVLSKKAVTVYMVDYGTISLIKKTHLRFLHKGFLRFPIQAIPAKLIGIQPLTNNAKWPAKTSMRFLELLRVPALKAEVVDIEPNFSVENSGIYKSTETSLEIMYRLSMILYDISKPQKLCINKQLIDDGLAVADGKFTFAEEHSTEKEKKIKVETSSLVEPNIYKFIEVQNKNEEKDKKLDDVVIQDKMNELKIKEEKKSPNNTNHCLNNYPISARPNLTLSQYFDDSIPGNEKNIFQEPSEKIEFSNPNFPSKPPGLENANVASNINLTLLINILLKEDNLNKNENLPILELLIKNRDLQDVALNDPLLALRLAFQMLNKNN